MKQKKKQINQRLHVDAVEKDDSTFEVRISGDGFTKETIGKFFDALQDVAEVSDTFITFPVLRALEDPAFMAELDRRIESHKNGTAKSISLEEFRARMNKKFPPKAPVKCVNCDGSGYAVWRNEEDYKLCANCDGYGKK